MATRALRSRSVAVLTFRLVCIAMLPPQHLIPEVFGLQTRSVNTIPGMIPKRRERDFESVVEREKRFKKVLALKEILLKEPEHVVSMGEFGILRQKMGRKIERRLYRLTRLYPAVFDTYEDEDRVLWCGFSERMEELIALEMEMQRDYEPVAVEKLRKLLMMAVDKRLHVPKIAHLRRDLGLPEDFQKRMVFEYPQFFRVVEQSDGPVLELTAWDSSLAVTELEKKAGLEAALGISKREPQFKFCFPKHFSVSPNQKAVLEKFQALPFISPYSDITMMEGRELEFDKRNVILIHEILSMTHEKKTIYDYLTHFRKEYRLPKSVMAFLLRHYSVFYVSRKGTRLTAFLKEAYNGMNLIEKNEWSILKERYLELIALGKGVKKTGKPDPVEGAENQVGVEVEESISGNGTDEGESVEESSDEDNDKIMMPATSLGQN